MRKFTKTEKAIIALCDTKEYATYDCPKGGICQVRTDLEQICPYCKQKHEPLANIEELRDQFRKELRFEL